MNKRGISPLASTILLVVLAIGIGVIVMNWGRAQLEGGSKCAIDTGLNVVELNSYPQLCYSGSEEEGFVKLIVENGASTDISSLQLRVIGSKEVYTLEILDSYIERGYTLQKIIPYNFNIFGKIKEIRITPRIIPYPGEDSLLCTEQALTVGNIREC